MTTRDTRINLALGATAGFFGGVLSLMLLTGHLVRAQDASDKNSGTIRAEEFQLMDESGRTRAMLTFSAEGHPYFTMLDRNGNHILWLGISDNSGLAISDVDGKTRLVLSLDRSGEPSLVIRDRQQKTRSFQPE